MEYSRLHTGGAGVKSVALSVVHVKIALPISSKPELQVYVAASPTEFPVSVTMPFAMSAGSGHRTRAAVQE